MTFKKIIVLIGEPRNLYGSKHNKGNLLNLKSSGNFFTGFIWPVHQGMATCYIQIHFKEMTAVSKRINYCTMIICLRCLLCLPLLLSVEKLLPFGLLFSSAMKTIPRVVTFFLLMGHKMCNYVFSFVG